MRASQSPTRPGADVVNLLPSGENWINHPPAMCGPDVLDLVDSVFGPKKATVPWPSWDGWLPTTSLEHLSLC